MLKIYSVLIEITAASVFIFPLFCLYEKIFIRNIKQMIVYIIISLYFTAILSLVGFPNISDITFDITLNLIPFIDNISYFVSACLNIILFIPLGIILPAFWGKYRNGKSITVFALCITLGIELSQIFTYRTTDILDIITNISGAWIGYIAIKMTTAHFSKCSNRNYRDKDLYIILGTVLIIMFFMQPFVSSFLWELIL